MTKIQREKRQKGEKTKRQKGKKARRQDAMFCYFRRQRKENVRFAKLKKVLATLS